MRICVFCGSKAGHRPIHATAARSVGRLLAERGMGLVYGGGHVGLMGILADAVLDAGGQVIGVIPRSMVEEELAHQRLTELHVVGSMHERKALMASKSHGFMALPGGYGTVEELFEIITWRQLRLHDKPIGILNVAGFFDPLMAWLDHAIAEGFLARKHRNLVHVSDEPEALFAWMIDSIGQTS